MKRKLVIALITWSLIQPQACWANEASNQLENIIESVKSKFDIPNELSEFNYNTYDDTWNLSWNRKDHKESMDISCTSEGNVLSYYHFTEEENSSRSPLAQMDADEAKKMAEDFLKKVVPEYADHLAVSEVQIPTTGENYDFNFYLTQDGVKVHNHRVDISVDKEAGTIENFNGFKFDSCAKYDGSVPVLTEEKAQSLYLSKIGLPLGYHTYFDDNQTKQAFLAYAAKDSEAAISAKTGESVQTYKDGEVIYAGGAKDEGMSATGDIAASEKLSPAEKEAVAATKDYMPVEMIKNKISAYFPAVKAMSILNTSVQKDSFGNCRYINMGIKQGDETVAEADISCDAKTGALNSYNYYMYNDEPKEIGTKWTKAQAQGFIQKVSPKQSSEVSFIRESTNEYNKNLQDFVFTRMYKGLPVCDEGIEFTYSTSLNEVIGYNVNWGQNILFPSQEGVLSKESIMKSIGLELCYMQTGEHAYALVYGIESDSNLFDAFSGKCLDWQGKEIISPASSFYTDLKGNKAEETIKKLYNSGIYLEGTMLKPNKAITQQEMLRLLEQAKAWFEGDSQIYEIAVTQGLLEESEKAPDKQITRGEGVKYIINATPYKKLAMQNDLYQYPYKDEKANETIKGYVTVAYGLNILDHKVDGFAPEELLTKEDAMVMIYNLLQNR